MVKTLNLEGSLWRQEHKEKFRGEQEAFYHLVDDMFKSDQIDEVRIRELMERYNKFEIHGRPVKLLLGIALLAGHFQ